MEILIQVILIMMFSILVTFSMTWKIKKKEVDPNQVQRILSSLKSIDLCGTVNDYDCMIEELNEADRRIKSLSLMRSNKESLEDIEKGLKFIDIQMKECNRRIEEAFRWEGVMIGRV